MPVRRAALGAALLGRVSVWVSVGPHSSPVPIGRESATRRSDPLPSCTLRGRATSTACGAPGEDFLYVVKPGRMGPGRAAATFRLARDMSGPAVEEGVEVRTR